MYFYSLGDAVKAIASYSRAIELNPAAVDFYLNRAIAYRVSKQFRKALADCDRIISLAPRHIYAYNQSWTLVRSERGKWEEILLKDGFHWYSGKSVTVINQ